MLKVPKFPGCAKVSVANHVSILNELPRKKRAKRNARYRNNKWSPRTRNLAFHWTKMLYFYICVQNVSWVEQSILCMLISNEIKLSFYAKKSSILNYSRNKFSTRGKLGDFWYFVYNNVLDISWKKSAWYYFFPGQIPMLLDYWFCCVYQGNFVPQLERIPFLWHDNIGVALLILDYDCIDPNINAFTKVTSANRQLRNQWRPSRRQQKQLCTQLWYSKKGPEQKPRVTPLYAERTGQLGKGKPCRCQNMLNTPRVNRLQCTAASGRVTMNGSVQTNWPLYVMDRLSLWIGSGQCKLIGSHSGL